MKMKESGRRWALLIGLSLLLGMGCASMSTQERSLQGVWYACSIALVTALVHVFIDERPVPRLRKQPLAV